LTVIIELFVGQILQYGEDVLIQQLPIFLISIPVINGVGGNIGSILGAHLASGLHVGSIKIDYKDKQMNEKFITALLMGITTYFFLSIGIYLMGVLGIVEMNIGFISLIFIIIATGAVLVCLVSVVSVLTAFISFKKGIDPDDIVAPVVTTLGDTIGIIFLFVFIGVVI
jgi:mgtE-like transporter